MGCMVHQRQKKHIVVVKWEWTLRKRETQSLLGVVYTLHSLSMNKPLMSPLNCTEPVSFDIVDSVNRPKIHSMWTGPKGRRVLPYAVCPSSPSTCRRSPARPITAYEKSTRILSLQSNQISLLSLSCHLYGLDVNMSLVGWTESFPFLSSLFSIIWCHRIQDCVIKEIRRHHTCVVHLKW